jgi:hypothetical protein
VNRFEANSIPEPNSGCWIWLGQVNQYGYGRLRLPNGGTQVAHRASYEFHNQTTVPDHLQVDHLCTLRCCVNPDHLEVVTRVENVRRAVQRNRATNRCRNGHEMTGDNVWLRKNGNRTSRVCRICACAARTKYRAK